MKRKLYEIINYLLYAIIITAIYYIGGTPILLALLCGLIITTTAWVADYFVGKNKYLDMLLIVIVGCFIGLCHFIASNNPAKFWSGIMLFVIFVAINRKKGKKRNNYPIPPLDRL